MVVELIQTIVLQGTVYELFQVFSRCLSVYLTSIRLDLQENLDVLEAAHTRLVSHMHFPKARGSK